MRNLDRKLVRDLLQIRTQALAIALVIACGVATYVINAGIISALESAQASYYQRNHFADVFAHVKRAPNALAARIAEIPGVSRVQTRVVVDVTLDMSDMPEPAIGRIVSVPWQSDQVLNRVHLRSGRYIAPGRGGEVLVSEPFARAHRLRPGDQITAIINQRREELTVVGTAISPEYVLSMRAGDLLPDDRRFAVLWMGHPELSAAFGLDGAFNDAALSLEPGASVPAVLERLDDLTARYGGVGAYAREDQVSHQRVSDEISELRRSALIATAVFTGIAAFILNMVISRVVSTQREQIALLRAFGYTGGEVAAHYLKLVLIIAAAGIAIGVLVGLWAGRGMMTVYARFFLFPSMEFRLGMAVVLPAAAISAAAGLLGAVGAVRRAANLPPAEAMRPEPPASYRPTLVERLGLQRLFSQPARMVLRHLERRPIRSALAALGIALGVAVLVLGGFFGDTINHMVDVEFRRSQRQDLTVTFVEPASARARHDLEHLSGVLRCEPFRHVPARLRNGHRSHLQGILGLDGHGELYRPLDARRRPIPMPPDGLVLSHLLAGLLGAREGDRLTVEVLEGQRPVLHVPVAAVAHDNAGLSAYMDAGAVNRLMGEAGTLSGAFLSTDPRRMSELYPQLKRTPRVGAVTAKEAMVASFMKTVAENLLLMQTIQLVAAVIITFGIVYNAARVSLSERGRELATLRVLGLSRREVSAILLGELAVLVLAALPVGLLLGRLLAGWLTMLMATESHRFPLWIEPRTYVYAALVTVVAGLASALAVRRRIDRLDLVGVLKARE